MKKVSIAALAIASLATAPAAAIAATGDRPAEASADVANTVPPHHHYHHRKAMVRRPPVNEPAYKYNYNYNYFGPSTNQRDYNYVDHGR
jgi:hypothetical protein